MRTALSVLIPCLCFLHREVCSTVQESEIKGERERKRKREKKQFDERLHDFAKQGEIEKQKKPNHDTFLCQTRRSCCFPLQSLSLSLSSSKERRKAINLLNWTGRQRDRRAGRLIQRKKTERCIKNILIYIFLVLSFPNLTSWGNRCRESLHPKTRRKECTSWSRITCITWRERERGRIWMWRRGRSICNNTTSVKKRRAKEGKHERKWVREREEREVHIQAVL